MKKKFNTILCVLLLSAIHNKPLNAASDYEANFQPKDDKTYKAYGLFRILYTENFSSKIHLSHETYEIDGKIEGMDVSEKKTESSDTIVDVYLFELSSFFNRDRLKFTLGAAFNYFRQKAKEEGTFTYNMTKQMFENNTIVDFYSPKFEFEAYYDIEEMKFRYLVEYVPIYYYQFEQNIFILPLVPSGEKSNSYSDTCQPYVKNDVRLTIKFVEFQFIHEYQKIKFKLLTLKSIGGGNYEFQPEVANYYISNFTLLLNLRINLIDKSDLVIGGGKKFERTVNSDTNEIAIKRSQWVFDIGIYGKI